MKKIFLLLIATLAFNVNAALVETKTTIVNESSGDSLLVDFDLINANPDGVYFEALFTFDENALTLDDNFGVLGFEANQDLLSHASVDGEEIDDGEYLVYITFDNIDWSNYLSNNQSLGQAKFNITSDGVTDFNFLESYAENIDENEVSPQLVPEPPVLALYVFGFLILGYFRKTIFKTNH